MFAERDTRLAKREYVASMSMCIVSFRVTATTKLATIKGTVATSTASSTLALARAQPVVCPPDYSSWARAAAPSWGPKLGSISGLGCALKINLQWRALFSGLINQLVCCLPQLPHSGATRDSDLDSDSVAR